ncbi:MAG: WG repeat-containing protein [Bacteroidales bacterium]|nr:WG repeat-containing protein [Bacteroidales bacterium]
MKLVLIIFCISFFLFDNHSQTIINADNLTDFSNGFALVTKADKAWLIDTLGNKLQSSDFEFKPVSDNTTFSDGLICLSNENGGRYMKTNGEDLISAAEGFILPFKEGIGIYQSKLKILTNEDLKRQGIEISEEFIHTRNVSDGYEKTIRFINTSGEELFTKTIITWLGYGNPQPTNGFHNGYCIIEMPFFKEDDIGMNVIYCIFNRKGEQTGEFFCDSHAEFSEGLCAVKMCNKWSYIDTTGKIVIDKKFTCKPGDFFNGLAAFMGENNFFGYINMQGEVVIKPQYAKVYPFHSGLAIIQMPYERTNMDYTFGYCSIDMEGKVAYRYGKVYVESDAINGLIIIKKNKLKGIMDISGSIKVFPEFDELRPFSCGLAYALKKSKYGDTEGYINGMGEFVVVKGK